MHTFNIKTNFLAVNAEYSYRATYGYSYTCNVYNMSGRVVSDIQTRAEGESLYIRYNTYANDSSYKFIGEIILKINVV